MALPLRIGALAIADCVSRRRHMRRWTRSTLRGRKRAKAQRQKRSRQIYNHLQCFRSRETLFFPQQQHAQRPLCGARPSTPMTRTRRSSALRQRGARLDVLCDSSSARMPSHTNGNAHGRTLTRRAQRPTFPSWACRNPHGPPGGRAHAWHARLSRDRTRLRPRVHRASYHEWSFDCSTFRPVREKGAADARGR